MVTAKYFPEECIDYTDTPWRSIPTPHLQGVFEVQGMTGVVLEWAYAMLGKMAFGMDECLDGWQIIPVFYGAAGSGKSLVVETVVQHMYEPTKVGTLNNNMESR